MRTIETRSRLGLAHGRRKQQVPEYKKKACRTAPSSIGRKKERKKERKKTPVAHTRAVAVKMILKERAGSNKIRDRYSHRYRLSGYRTDLPFRLSPLRVFKGVVMPRRSPSASETRPAVRRSSRLNKTPAGKSDFFTFRLEQTDAMISLLCKYLDTDWHAAGTRIQPALVIQIEGPKKKRRKTAKTDSDSLPQQHNLECTEDVLGITDIIAHTVTNASNATRNH